ncbi:unnamed protein product [Nippostrongylus brasiliensis]|uniref:Not1 domain-containing protein n=1 Tax=Nippostrongylus brasiliensis TaxID=27835 RepID=A0A0N4XQC6_NIPBR|nr:unnamed protein product [Nippostrongylus brasiliensis]
MFVHRNHSIHDQLWDPNFEMPNEQTTAWLASVRLCDRLLTRYRTKFDELVKERFDTVVVDDLYNPCGMLQVALKGEKATTVHCIYYILYCWQNRGGMVEWLRALAQDLDDQGSISSQAEIIA